MFSFEFLLEFLVEAAKGIPAALMITIVSIGLSLVIGFLLALVRINKLPVLNWFAILFVSIIRGTPVIAQLFLVYFTLPMAVMAIFDGVNLYNANPMLFAYIVFTLNASASMTEIIRSALTAIDKGQMEAARTVGMTGLQAYIRIIIPQAIVIAMPAIGNLTTTILKMTSLAMQISVLEITGRAKTAASESYRYLEGYVACLIIYLFLNFFLERLFRYIENRSKRFKSLAV